MPSGAGKAPGRANGALINCLRAGESLDIVAILRDQENIRKTEEQKGKSIWNLKAREVYGCKLISSIAGHPLARS